MKKPKKQKEKYKFVFPNFAAKMMKDVPMRTQLESSMISMSLILISLTLMAIYFLFFGGGTIPFRILLLINLFAGFLFISSFLLTTYQQYISYMQMMGFDPQKEREEVLKRGKLFKRIKLALKERKKVKIKEKENIKERNKPPMFPELVDEALKRRDIIREEQEKDIKKLKKVAKKLEEKQNIQIESKEGPKT